MTTKIEITLNQQSLEMLHRLMPKYGSKTVNEFFVHALHCLNSFATYREDGLTQVMVRNPKSNRQEIVAIGGLR